MSTKRSDFYDSHQKLQRDTNRTDTDPLERLDRAVAEPEDEAIQWTFIWNRLSLPNDCSRSLAMIRLVLILFCSRLSRSYSSPAWETQHNFTKSSWILLLNKSRTIKQIDSWNDGLFISEFKSTFGILNKSEFMLSSDCELTTSWDLDGDSLLQLGDPSLVPAHRLLLVPWQQHQHTLTSHIQNQLGQFRGAKLLCTAALTQFITTDELFNPRTTPRF